ncbi:MAG: glycosyltransferase [Desulfuromonadales bacterium]
MNVAFFQRIFAHYRSGLIKELALNSENKYQFFASNYDTSNVGIDLIPFNLLRQIIYTQIKTIHLAQYITLQFHVVSVALFSQTIDVFILEGNFLALTNWLALIILKIRRKRTILHTHGWLRAERSLKFLLRNLFYNLADGLLLYGERAKQIGLAQGFRPDKLYVAYNCLDDEAMGQARMLINDEMCQVFKNNYFGVGSGYPLIVSVGRLTDAKQYSILIEAAKYMLNHNLPINVMLVGEGTQRSNLENLAIKYRINVIFAGTRYDEEFLSLCFTSADLVVIPGAAGLTVIHSLFYGTPVIINDDIGRQMPESEVIQEGINGARFKAGDCVDLAKVITQSLLAFPRNTHTKERCHDSLGSKYYSKSMRSVFDDAVAGRNPSDLK